MLDFCQPTLLQILLFKSTAKSFIIGVKVVSFKIKKFYREKKVFFSSGEKVKSQAKKS